MELTTFKFFFRRIVYLESLQEEFSNKGDKELQVGRIANEKYILMDFFGFSLENIHFFDRFSLAIELGSWNMHFFSIWPKVRI